MFQKPIFGSSTPNHGAFGQQQQQALGTAHVKYNSGVEKEVLPNSMKVVSNSCHCITFMKEYENKSLEELRFEDYVAGRKGDTADTSGVFQQQTEREPLFGNTCNFSFGTSTPSPSGGFKSTTGISASDDPFMFGAATSTQPTTEGDSRRTPTTKKVAELRGLFPDYEKRFSSMFLSAPASPFGEFKPTTSTSVFGAPPASGTATSTQPTTEEGSINFWSSTASPFAECQRLSNVKPSTSWITAGSPSIEKRRMTVPRRKLGDHKDPNSIRSGLSSVHHLEDVFAQQQQQAPGTAHVKYDPVKDTDEVVKYGTTQIVKVKHQCITFMREYNKKSLEELRLEDYVAGRKPNTTNTSYAFWKIQKEPFFGNKSFGQPATTSASSVFGGGPLSGGLAQQNSWFANDTQSTTGLLGASKPAPGPTPTTGDQHNTALDDMQDLKNELMKLKEGLKATVLNEFRSLREELAEVRSSVNAVMSGQNIPQTDVDKFVARLRSEINDKQQELLANDIQIENLPETSGENPVQMVLLVASNVGVRMKARDIASASRVGGRGFSTEQSRPRFLVVRFRRRDLREQLLQAARSFRDLTSTDLDLPGPATKFYVNERLTKLNRDLFRKAREAGARLGWQFVWTKRGRIFARNRPGESACLISDENDLRNIFGSDRSA